MIRLAELLDESSASEEADRLGLDYMSFGRWGKNGKVTHISKNGRLAPVSADKGKSLVSYDKPRHSAHGDLKVAPRMPSIKKRIKTRISPERFLRHNMGIKAPKGLGLLTNPQKMLYNKIYNHLHFGL